MTTQVRHTPVRDGLTDAQLSALLRLVHDGVISPGQGESVRDAIGTAASHGRSAGWLVEVAGYAGGGLLLSGIALFLGASWQDLTSTQRIATLAGLALAFLAAAVLIAGGPTRVGTLAARTTTAPGAPPASPARRRIVGLLLALTTVPIGFAVGIALDPHDNAAFVGALAATAVGLAGMIWLPTAAGLVASGLASTVMTTALAGDILHASDVTEGMLLLGLGLIWMVGALIGPLPTRPLGIAIGTALAIVGPQYLLVEDSAKPLAYGLTFAVSVGSLLLYRRVRSNVLLAAGVVGVTLAVPEAVDHWTNGSLGGAAVLLLAGSVLIAASAVGLRLRRVVSRSDMPTSNPVAG
jgi:predicted membrane protein DUF2157